MAIGVVLEALAVLLFAGALAGCGGVAPECKGDPALIPCTCMNPRSPQCPPPPMDAKKKGLTK